VFEQMPSVLVEVRHPGMGTAPDWRPFDDADQLDVLLPRLGLRAELYLSSVWDLKNPKGAIRLTK
jgi:hypothetical protein